MNCNVLEIDHIRGTHFDLNNNTTLSFGGECNILGANIWLISLYKCQNLEQDCFENHCLELPPIVNNTNLSHFLIQSIAYEVCRSE